MGWNSNDEQRRTELQRELTELNKARNDAVLRAVAVFVDAGLNDSHAQCCIEHADAIRDALAPFDSGVREAVAEPINHQGFA